jgi:hypothetical protein
MDLALVILTRCRSRSLLRILSCLSPKTKIRYSQELKVKSYLKLMIQRTVQLLIVVSDNQIVNFCTTKVSIWTRKLHMVSFRSTTSQLAGAIHFAWCARTKMRLFLFELRLLREVVKKLRIAH